MGKKKKAAVPRCSIKGCKQPQYERCSKCKKWYCKEHSYPVQHEAYCFEGKTKPASKPAAAAAGAPAPAWESPDVPSGAVLVHHQDAWHGSGPNTTADRPRRSLVVHLLRDDVRFADAHASDYLRHPGAAGAANYIYARYKRLGDDALDEAFFPTTYREGGGRADFLEGYCSTVPPLCGD